MERKELMLNDADNDDLLEMTLKWINDLLVETTRKSENLAWRACYITNVRG